MTIVPLVPDRFDQFTALIRALAAYERLDPPDAAGTARLRADAFSTPPRFEAALALDAAGHAVGYAVWFETYSTLLARPTMYLEDLFVLESARQSGAGSRLFEHVRELGRKRGCGRMDWQVLEWNALARDFYRRRHAEWLKEWLTYRITY
jgi:GNAT superfamily N-acetyltransferase